MRLPNYRNTVMLNTSYWLEPILKEMKQLNLPPHFHMDLIKVFFVTFASIMHRGHYDFLSQRRLVKEEMLALIIGDMEGRFHSKEGMYVPREFEPPEIKVIVLMSCYMYDDILLSIDSECLETRSDIDFIRMAGYDMLYKYESYRHPFQGANATQLGIMRRQNDGDLDEDIAPVRAWV